VLVVEENKPFIYDIFSGKIQKRGKAALSPGQLADVFFATFCNNIIIHLASWLDPWQKSTAKARGFRREIAQILVRQLSGAYHAGTF